MHFRIGHGFDLHQFVMDRDLILGGVKIDHNKGLLGHSDADALCHANPQYYGCDSTELLAQTLYEVVRAGYKVNNIDATIKTQSPRLAPFINDIRANLASVLNLNISQISVKAKTMEMMGPIGEGKCLAVDAVVMLEEIAI